MAADLAYFLEQARIRIRTGSWWYEGEVEAEVRELVEYELGSADEAMIAAVLPAAKKLFAQQLADEMSWTGLTTNDRIDLAFDELDARGIVALQNAGYTQSDGWDDCNEVADRASTPPRGAVFYHGQDAESAAAGHGLYLTFGAYEADRAEHEAQSLEIARELVDALTQHGVPTEWDGTIKTRVFVKPFEWRRRRGAVPTGS